MSSRRRQLDAPALVGSYGALTRALDRHMTGDEPLDEVTWQRVAGAFLAVSAVLDGRPITVELVCGPPERSTSVAPTHPITRRLGD